MADVLHLIYQVPTCKSWTALRVNYYGCWEEFPGKRAADYENARIPWVRQQAFEYQELRALVIRLLIVRNQLVSTAKETSKKGFSSAA